VFCSGLSFVEDRQRGYRERRAKWWFRWAWRVFEFVVLLDIASCSEFIPDLWQSSTYCALWRYLVSNGNLYVCIGY